jgi:hypothetical protein
MVLTQDALLFQAIRDGFAPSIASREIELLNKSEDAVARLCNPDVARAPIAFVDFSTIVDGNRFVDFVKSSPSTRSLNVIAVTDGAASSAPGTPQAQSIMHVLGKPISSKELARIAEALRLQSGE